MTSSVNNAERSTPPPASGVLAVPWLTVVPLAVVLAFVDGFWVVSLRGATGAIERTQAPFASWLRESTVLAPLFAVAVLAALTVALMWFGPELGRASTVIATGLLVVVAATLVGMVVLTASATYDYHLQTEQARMMAAMGDSCSATCVAAQNDAALMLQVKSVGYGSLILLVSNLVTVGWLVAMRGGRLAVTAGRQGRVSRSGDLRVLVAAGLVGTAGIQGAVLPGHVWPTGVLLLLLSAAHVAVAVTLLSRPTRGPEFAAAAVSLAALLVACASVLGDAGLADVMASILAFGTLLVAVALIRAGPRSARGIASTHLSRLGLCAVLALTVLGLAGSGLPWLDAFGITANGTTTHH